MPLGLRRLRFDDSCTAPALIAGAGIFAVLKGLREPNLWAATQIQIDYTHGLVKRGAAGALLHLLHIPIERYWVFAFVSFAILALVAILLIVFLRQRAPIPDQASMTIIFASSFAVTFFVHIVGYLDIILLALTLIVLIQPRRGLTTASAYLVSIAGILIHESFLLSFFPVVWFTFILEAAVGEGAARRRARIHSMVLPLLVLLEAAYIAVSRPMSPQRIGVLRSAIMARVDFPVRLDFFDVLGNSAADSLHLMWHRFFWFSWWIAELGALLSLLWVAIFFAHRSVRLLREHSAPRKALLTFTVLAASLCPMLLQLLGWDLYRWYATACFTAFLVYCVLALRLAPPSRTTSVSRISTAAFVLCAINLSTAAGLADGYKINTFPFIDGLYDLAMSYKQSGHLPLPTQ